MVVVKKESEWTEYRKGQKKYLPFEFRIRNKTGEVQRLYVVEDVSIGPGDPVAQGKWLIKLAEGYIDPILVENGDYNSYGYEELRFEGWRYVDLNSDPEGLALALECVEKNDQAVKESVAKKIALAEAKKQREIKAAKTILQKYGAL